MLTFLSRSSLGGFPLHQQDAAKYLTSEFKYLRKTLKDWSHTLSNLKQSIERIKFVLGFLILLEGFRDLSLVEWNFRGILEQQLIALLKDQKTYWKQREPIKWVTLGDTRTQFFYAHPTIKHRRNMITSLIEDNANTLCDHDSKTDLLQNSFKARLGTTSFSGIQSDLPQFFATQ